MSLRKRKSQELRRLSKRTKLRNDARRYKNAKSSGAAMSVLQPYAADVLRTLPDGTLADWMRTVWQTQSISDQVGNAVVNRYYFIDIEKDTVEMEFLAAVAVLAEQNLRKPVVGYA